MCIAPLAVLDQQGGQEPPLAIPLQVGHQRLGQGAGRPPQGGQHEAQPLMGDVFIREHRQQLGPSLVNLQEEGHEVPLERNGRRPGIRFGHSAPGLGELLGPPTPGAGALQLLCLDPELGGVHAELPGGLPRQRGGLLGIGHLGEDQGHAGMSIGPAPRRGQVLVGERLLEHEGEQGTRRVEPRGERGGTLGPQQAVGVVARRQERHPDRQVSRLLEAAGARDGPAQVLQIHHVVHHLLEARRGLLSGRIGVEEGHHLVGVAAQQAELGGRERGAERGHRLAEAVLMRHEAVEVALDDDGAAPLPHRDPGHVEGVEHLALHVERSLRRVEVLGLLARKRAAAEGHHAALDVTDGEQEPAAEAIVEAGPVLTGQDEPGLYQDVLADALPGHDAQQRVPALGRVAEPEALRHLRIHAALLEVGTGLLAAGLPERPGIELGGQRHRAPQRLQLAVHLGRPLARVGQGDTGAVGQGAHRLRKGHALLAHEEAEGVAARAAAEAVIDVPLRVHGE